MHSILARSVKVALQRHHITWNPVDTVDPPKATKYKVESPSIAEARAVRAAAKGDTDEARWLLALAVGLRPAEALGLAWDARDWSRLTIRRQLKYARTGSPSSST